jgi:cytochrome c oxidase subunit 3
MFVWWRDIVRESVVEKAHSPLVKLGLRYGMSLFITSEVMFFAAFFWAYYDSALFPREAIGHVWPPKAIHTFSPFDMPFMMTLILLLSGTTVTWAHHAILAGKTKEAARALAITVGLGFIFSCFQAFEYHHATFTIKDGIFGSTFYMATGFHGLHVIIGTIFLAVCWWRTTKGHFTPESHFGLEAAAWYWHFVDVVWLFLFISVYWYGSH